MAALAGCATPAGQPAARIAEPAIAAAYIPLHSRVDLGLKPVAGAAMVVLPGIAVTNAHNADLLDKRAIIGEAAQSDLEYFRVTRGMPATTAPPVAGESVIAYGEDTDRRLRVAHGVIREIMKVPGHSDSPYFTFAGDAGPGFSGGPVVDASGRLVGITFGFKDEGHERLIYAYDMARVQAELALVQKGARSPH